MNITERSLRKLIREELSNSYVAPVDGLTGLMQEFDVPVHSRKKISKTVQDVCSQNGGPLDASYAVEREVKNLNLPEDFYARAVSLVKETKLLKTEARSVQITRRQLSLLLKEYSNETDQLLLTEEELNEIAPIIGAIAGTLGRVAASAGPMLARGVSGLGRIAAKTPKLVQSIGRLASKAVDKLPNLKKYAEKIGLDFDNVDIGKLTDMLKEPPDEIKGELDKLLKGSADQFKQQDKCDCPSLEELQAAQKDL